MLEKRNDPKNRIAIKSKRDSQCEPLSIRYTQVLLAILSIPYSPNLVNAND